LVIGNPVDYQARIGLPPRKWRKATPLPPWPFGHPDQEDHLVTNLGNPRIERADHFEIVA
jgi:hypothetical protein